MTNHPFPNEFKIEDDQGMKGNRKVFAVGHFYPYTDFCFLGTYSGNTTDGYIACLSPICVEPPPVVTVRISNSDSLVAFFTMGRDYAYMWSRNENELASWDKHVAKLGLGSERGAFQEAVTEIADDFNAKVANEA
jgi:hypothetical protein